MQFKMKQKGLNCLMQSSHYYVVDQIEQALFALMKEKDYTSITVTDVIKRAQVSRASFYRHFSSLGDVIDHLLNRLFDNVNDEVISILLSYDEQRVRDFLFEYTYKNIEMQETLASCLPSNTAVFFSRLMSRMQENGRPDVRGLSREKYRLYARTGVINSVLMKWLADGKKESVEEIVNVILKYILKL